MEDGRKEKGGAGPGWGGGREVVIEVKEGRKDGNRGKRSIISFF